MLGLSFVAESRLIIIHLDRGPSPYSKRIL